MTHHTITSAHGGPRSPKPLRFKIGIGLLVLYPFLYLVIPIGPFLPIAVGARVGVIAGVLAAAEAIFVLGVACVGKEAYRAIKAKLGLGKKKRAREAARRLAAEASVETETETEVEADVDRDEPARAAGGFGASRDTVERAAGDIVEPAAALEHHTENDHATAIARSPRVRDADQSADRGALDGDRGASAAA
ncbi:transporter suffix domain-containing protein [Leucobacter sp. gxy201]|uniref:transporter suffix domain-containing protein n=1 Tax=Leucobacter sp. gxy201 TaxID=2957200 RepID=UPI003DA1886E